MKTVAIYFSDPETLGYPLNKKFFFESYAEIIEKMAERGVKTVIVRNDSYQGAGTFANHFIWDGTTYQNAQAPITVDLIWNRDAANTIPEIQDCPMVNLKAFDAICRDKMKTYQTLKDFSSPTFLVQSFEEARTKVAKLEGERIVLKPQFGEQSEGVYIIKKEALEVSLYENWKNIIVQEFIDSSGGIPNLAEGVHEININMVNGNFAGARIKNMHEGVFVATVTGAKGGCEVHGIPFKKVPKDLWEIIKKLDKELERFNPRIYRADFAKGTQGYRLIEINSRPGVTHPEKEGELYWDFNGQIIESLISYLDQ